MRNNRQSPQMSLSLLVVHFVSSAVVVFGLLFRVDQVVEGLVLLGGLCSFACSVWLCSRRIAIWYIGDYWIDEISLEDRPGFVYVMCRADGVYKLGRSTDPTRRLFEHIEDYRQEFQIIKYFAVSDMITFEALALRATCRYRYTEPGRNELRRMNKRQLKTFLKRFEKAILEAGEQPTA